MISPGLVALRHLAADGPAFRFVWPRLVTLTNMQADWVMVQLLSYLLKAEHLLSLFNQELDAKAEVVLGDAEVEGRSLGVLRWSRGAWRGSACSAPSWRRRSW